MGYRIFDNPEKEAFFGVRGGVRYWHLKTDLTVNAGLLPGVTASRSRGWVDGIAGVRGSYALIAGYRYLDVNYNKDRVLFDMALQGPLFGLGIKF